MWPVARARGEPLTFRRRGTPQRTLEELVRVPVEDGAARRRVLVEETEDELVMRRELDDARVQLGCGDGSAISDISVVLIGVQFRGAPDRCREGAVSSGMRSLHRSVQSRMRASGRGCRSRVVVLHHSGTPRRRIAQKLATVQRRERTSTRGLVGGERGGAPSAGGSMVAVQRQPALPRAAGGERDERGPCRCSTRSLPTPRFPRAALG